MRRTLLAVVLTIVAAHVAAAQTVRPPRPPRTPTSQAIPMAPLPPVPPAPPAAPRLDVVLPPDLPNWIVDIDPDAFTSIGDAFSGIDFDGIRETTSNALADLQFAFAQNPLPAPP